MSDKEKKRETGARKSQRFGCPTAADEHKRSGEAKRGTEKDRDNGEEASESIQEGKIGSYLFVLIKVW